MSQVELDELVVDEDELKKLVLRQGQGEKVQGEME